MYNESTALAVISDAIATATKPAFTANRKAMLAALASICNTVERRNTIPIVSNVKMQSLALPDGHMLEMTGTDLDIEVKTSIAIANDWADFDATLPAHQLRDLLKKASGELVTFTMTQEHVDAWEDDKDSEGKPIKRQSWSNGRVSLTFDNGATATLGSLPPVDFPQLNGGDAVEWSHTFQIKAADFVAGFAGVAFAISTEETRYYLNGVCMHFVTNGPNGINGLCTVATDGHRLGLRSIPALVPTNIPGLIVPRKTVLDMLKQIGKKPDGAIKISLNSSRIRFSHGETVVTSKVIDGTFPDYQRVIPRNNQHTVTVNKAAFAAMVEHVSMMAVEKCRAVKLDIADGKITATVHNPDAGTSTASMPANVPDGCNVTVGFNSRYLLDMCGALPGDTLDLSINDHGSPALFTSPADARALVVLMPMRV